MKISAFISSLVVACPAFGWELSSTVSWNHIGMSLQYEMEFVQVGPLALYHESGWRYGGVLSTRFPVGDLKVRVGSVIAHRDYYGLEAGLGFGSVEVGIHGNRDEVFPFSRLSVSF
jgi:hypothetical protein